MKRKKLLIIFMVFIGLLILAIELKPVKQSYSSVFSTSGEIEIELDIIMNTLLPVDVDAMVDKVVTEHQEINGIRENSIYKIHLYRTNFHYKREWKYDTIIMEGIKKKDGISVLQ